MVIVVAGSLRLATADRDTYLDAVVDVPALESADVATFRISAVEEPCSTRSTCLLTARPLGPRLPHAVDRSGGGHIDPVPFRPPHDLAQQGVELHALPGQKVVVERGHAAGLQRVGECQRPVREVDGQPDPLRRRHSTRRPPRRRTGRRWRGPDGEVTAHAPHPQPVGPQGVEGGRRERGR
jgi:hypothetical protein